MPNIRSFVLNLTQKVSPKFLLIILLFIAAITICSYLYRNNLVLLSSQVILKEQLKTNKKELEALKNQDQVKRNNLLQEEIININKTYQQSLTAYEEILKLKTSKLREDYAQILAYLSKRNYSSGSAILANLNQKISSEKQKLVVAQPTVVQNIPTNNQPPSSGFQKQQVQTDNGTFLVSIVAADLNSTRIIVDTASESDCANDCPVLSLADYVSRNGAYAAVNGSYFCPATYPSCTDKKNTFDTLLMNKNKKYFNSDNNVYSTVPLAAFNGTSAIFKERSLDWGRDTGVDAVIANRPLLLLGGEIKFGGAGEAKEDSRGGRSFIGSKGSTVYIGVVHSATVAESAKALKALGLENALNLDDGGSTALWFNGYQVGPGRNLPNAVLFVRK